MQIVFESRLGAHDVLNNCMMTVDGTDLRIPQKGIATKGNAFASHKYTGKSALCYELGINILAGNLVRIQGPYPAGKYTDINNFQQSFASLPVEPTRAILSGNDMIPAENRGMQGRVRARHETLNGRLKN